jgi:hypothetical protein
MALSLRAVLFLFACSALFAQSTPSDSGAGSISGTVRDIAGGRPLADVGLILVGPSGRVEQNASGEGQFKFSDLKPATHHLSAHGEFGEVLGSNSLDLKPDHEIAEVNLVVLPSGSISGRVTDERDGPVARVQVLLIGTGLGGKGVIRYQTGRNRPRIRNQCESASLRHLRARAPFKA